MGRGRSGRLMRLGVMAGILAVTATGCSLSEVEDKLRFGWPRGITDQAEKMRVLWTWSTVTALAVGVLVWGLIFWSIIVYRKKGDELPRQVKYNHPIETLYTVVPFLVISVLFYYTVLAQNFVTETSEDPDVSVEAVAFQWNWKFNYLDRTDEVSGEPLNTIGTSNEIPILVLPVGQTVLIHERATDVIHSFWVPEFLFKRDVIPGRDNSFEITIKPGQEGAYVGRCAELCGTYHSMMNFEVRAVSPQTYQDYLDALDEIGNDDPDRQAKALAEVGLPPRATTTHPFETDRTHRAPSEGG